MNFFFQAEDGIRDQPRSRGLGDVYKRQGIGRVLGISRDRVRNLERDGLRGLRRLSDNVEAYFVS